MKLIAAVLKSFKENIRDWKVLALVMLFSPFFLILIYLLYGQSPTTYNIGIVNLDGGSASAELIGNIENIKAQNDIKLFHLINTDKFDDLKIQVKDKKVDIGIIIPRDYSKVHSETKINETISPVVVDLYGCMSNTRYTVAAVMVSDIINKQGLAAANITIPISISETFLEKKLPLNEFYGYVPGLMTLAVLMILFTATASIVKENDKKTLIRLKLSNLGAFNYLLSVCIVQTIIAVVAIVISYWTALALGYRPEGNFESVLFVSIISSLSIVSISLVIASFLNTVFDVLTIGCFPFFVLMFFSGGMLPLPKINLITIGEHSFGITDILPLTHSVNAFNSILNYGARLNEVVFDIIMILVLTVLYFSVGLILYKKRKLSKS
jgi:ABC-type multidrug transport system, permease component